MEAVLREVADRLQTSREMLLIALILGRTMPMIFLTPFLGGKLVPPEVKMGLGLLLTIIVWPLAREAVVGEVPIEPLPFLMLMMKEAFVGFAIGFVNSHIFSALD